MECSYSEIYESLDAVSKKRYREKLDCIQEVAGDNIQDPYLSDKENVAHQDYPPVEFGDIYSYLINAPSPYTKNFPFVNGGMTSSAQYMPTLSLTVKPRSARTWLPGTSFFKRPQFSVMVLSDALPPQPREMKLIDPCGAMAIRYFTALWLL